MRWPWGLLPSINNRRASIRCGQPGLEFDSALELGHETTMQILNANSEPGSCLRANRYCRVCCCADEGSSILCRSSQQRIWKVHDSCRLTLKPAAIF
jgi:hypothetical protein